MSNPESRCLVMNFRKEYKYRLSPMESVGLENLLKHKGMVRLHPTRQVTSLYFDTRTLQMFHDSEEGVLPRRKHRVRSYGVGSRTLQLEKKISSLEGRFKISAELDKRELPQLLSCGLFCNQYGLIWPSIMISFTRKYFSLGEFRLTFDHNIKYVKPLSDRHIWSSQQATLTDNECVMEMKAKICQEDGLIKRMIPWPTQRFSKYSRGIAKLRLQPGGNTGC